MRQRLLLLALCSLVSSRALALSSNFPFVQGGPVITGVTATDAWVSWYTAHHEGSGTECTFEENTPILGDHNTDTPTLTLNTNAQFSDTNCSREHLVHVTGLSASTSYTFTLDKPWDSKNGTTAAGSFKTAPPAGSGAAVKFVVYGDTRNDQQLGGANTEPDHQAVVNAIITNESDAEFIVHTGDMALNLPAVSGDDKGYTEFFTVERALMANHPLFVVLGNHETIDTTFYDAMFDPARFDGSSHPYYSSFDWGKVHIAMGDSFEGSSTTLGLGGLNPAISDAQAQWLNADLQAAHSAHQASFVAIHQGPYSHTNDSKGHGGLADVVLKLVPSMVQYGALATFAGHDHYYQRGHEGCIDYLVLGGGGAPRYAPDDGAAGVAIGVQTLSYMVVSVTANGSASMVVKDTNGNSIDSLTFSVPDPGCGTSDAGSDAGSELDAGTDGGTQTDAGVADGGGDAGPVDAGIPDAGIPDAGSSDAGNRDAGSPSADGGNITQLDGGGCGCTTSNAGLVDGIALVLLFGLYRLRSRARAAAHD